MSPDLEDRIARIEAQLKLSEGYSVHAFWNALDRIYSITLSTRELQCIICEFVDKRSGFQVLTDHCMFGGGKLERYACPQCGCVFGPQKFLDLDEDFVDLDYRLLYSRYSEGDSTNDEIRTFRSLSANNGGIYLNWGSGGEWNRTIPQLREEGFEVWGFEPSAEANGPLVIKDRGAIGARFDGIFSNNVIEHFRDPVAQFREFHSLLKPNGRMAHSSPCYEYAFAFTRFHTVFLLGQSAEILADRTGFKIIDRIQDGQYINVVYDRL